MLSRSFSLGPWAFYLALAFLAVLQPFMRDTVTDEAWFLQVVRRTLSGEVPYRDFFLGVTPLSLYVTVPWTLLFGTEVVVLRAVQAAIKVAVSLLVARCAVRLGIKPLPASAAALACFLIVPPVADSLYSPLANLMLMVSFAASLEAYLTSQSKVWGLAGFLAGLAFASKQNIGAYALGAAVLSTAASAGWGGLLRLGLLVLLGFLVGALPPLVPVALEGAFPKFVEYGLMKGTYLRDAGFGFWDGLRQGLEGLLGSSEAVSQRLWYVSHIAAYLLIPAAAASGLISTALGSGRRRELLVLALFSGACLAGLYPRATIGHVATFVPYGLLWTLVAMDWVVESPPWGALARFLTPAFYAGLMASFLLVALLPAARVLSGGWVWSDLPHFRGVLLPADRVEVAREVAEALGRPLRDGQVFVASDWAAFYYLVSDGRNPTPYDFPLSTAMGLGGEDQVVEAVAGGQIPLVAVCDSLWSSRLAPRKVLAHVSSAMVPLGRAGPCELFGVGSSEGLLH